MAAERIGRGSEKYAMHVKGLELPAYDVRGAKAHGLGYATSYTGADHNKGYAIQEIFGLPFPYPVDRFAVEGQGRADDVEPGRPHRGGRLPDDVHLHARHLGGAVPLREHRRPDDRRHRAATSRPRTCSAWASASTTWRAPSICSPGLTRADDDLPERLKTEPIPQGPAKGHMIAQADLDLMLDEYYEARGWTPDGVPTRAKLEELRLGYAADKLGLA